MEGKEVVGSPGVRAWLLAALLCAALTATGRPAPGNDRFLIVEHPDRLVALNGYQQSLSPRDLLIFQPFAPMRIVKERDVLGDGFTPCMRVEIDGALFFLLRDRGGRLSAGDQAGSISTLAGNLLTRDTVHVLESGVLMLSSPVWTRDMTLRRGERLIRLFASEGRTYVRCPGRIPAYGWVSLSPATEKKEWSLEHAEVAVESLIPDRLRDSVRTALERTNRVLLNLYRFFNQQGGENRAIPLWQLEESGVSLLCRLTGASTERDFPRSTRYLMMDIQNYLLGTDFAAFELSDGIEIRPK
jgi:hypothetical protein